MKPEASDFSPYYIAPYREHWQGRVDPTPTIFPIQEESTHRIHQRIQFLDLQGELPKAPTPTQDLKSTSIALLGFRSDIGVSRNQGQPGAAEAPPVIRKAFANLAWHFPSTTTLFDAGDIQPVTQSTTQPESPDPLVEIQTILANQITRLHQHGYTPILLGGGHEIAKPHYLGTTAAYPDKRIGIINIDAHFDLRDDPRAPTSGTSFLEIYQHQQAASIPFDYLVLGLQQQSNTQALYETAHHTGTQYIHAADIDSTHHTLTRFLEPLDAVCFTICMDVFDATFAPGVSAPTINGLFPAQVLHLIKKIFSSIPVLSIDIAEVNPLNDHANRTSKLAAWLVYESIKNLNSKP